MTYDGTVLVKGTDYTVAYTNNTAAGTGTATITGMGDYTGSVTASFTITAGGNSGGNSGGSGSSSGGGSSSATTTEKLEDGTPVKVTTDKKTGTVTAAATYDDGTTVKSQTTTEGEVTASVTVSKTNGGEKTTVTIPTTVELAPGQVAVIVKPDGTEEIVKNSVATPDGMRITLTDSAELKIIDNTKTFVDVAKGNWAEESIAFVASREIFNGTGEENFTPGGDMSRAMVCQVLANFEGVDTAGGNTWYEKAVSWAGDAGISDGSNPEEVVTREQLAVMLYRHAGNPVVRGELISQFEDGGQVSNWAVFAMTWAIQNGIMNGRDGVWLAPKDTASRAEVAAMFARYVVKSVGK